MQDLIKPLAAGAAALLIACGGSADNASTDNASTDEASATEGDTVGGTESEGAGSSSSGLPMPDPEGSSSSSSGEDTSVDSASSSSGSDAEDALERLPLLGDVLNPEGIGVDTQTGDLYVGATLGGSIQRISGGEAEWWKTVDEGDGLRPVTVGVTVDSEGRRLIACTNAVDMATFEVSEAAVVVYDLDSRELLADVVLPPLGPSNLCNDVAVTAEGTIYASDSSANMLWAVDDAYQITPVVEPGVFAESSLPQFGANGLDITPDGRFLLITLTFDPHLYRFDLETEEVLEVELSGMPYPGGDGITFVDDDTLVSVQNAVEHDIVSVKFTGADYESATVASAIDDSEVFDSMSRPTTAALYEDRLFVVNGQFEIEVPELPFWVTSIPLSRLALD